MRTITAKARRQPPQPPQEMKLNLLDFATDVLIGIVTDGFNTLPAYRYADYVRDCATVRKRTRNEGLYFLTEILPGLASGLFDKLEGRPASYPGFVLSGGTPAFLKGCFQNAINGETEYIRFIYQVSVAFKKIEGKYSKATLVAQYAEFCDIDAGLEIDWFTPERVVILERARHYCSEFCKTLELDSAQCIPRPGPGAVNTKTPHALRYSPVRLYKRLHECMPYDEWFYPTPAAVILHERSREFLNLVKIDEPQSRFKFVPKTARKARGICIEENEVQFLQQGLRRLLTASIQQHPLYSRRIVLEDQSVNGWMAAYSSVNRRFATLDMSSASDRIARELVSYVFQDNKEIHNALMAVSTREIVPPPEARKAGFDVLKTKKFAPMGSAVCFPVMSLLFMFLIRAAITTSDAKYPHLLSTNCFVYGDDIVVPSSTYKLVCDCLESFGLKVNKAKSFVASHFRESCGIHAYKGVDVTPVFVRKLPQSNSIKSLLSLVETESQFYKRGWFCTSEVLRMYGARLKPRWFGKYAMYVPTTSDVIGWRRESEPTWLINSKRHKVRWNTKLHYHEHRVSTWHTKAPMEQMVCESSGLMRWFCISPKQRSSVADDNGTPFEISRVRSNAAVRISARSGWQPRSKIWT